MCRDRRQGIHFGGRKSVFKNGNVYSARILEFKTNSRKRRNKKQSSLKF